ncbi:hypothetical protein EI94DRAFT_372050 [Lactarius quietus]|nr:hypothetical protein EI94DRAFT_372050 [Lactarius quietus]
MANINLSAKSSCDWTENELSGFKIMVDTMAPATFFGTEKLPDPAISGVILTNEWRPQSLPENSDRLFYHYLTDAMIGDESFKDDFAAFILRMFKYDEPEQIIHQRKELSFVMCGTVVNAKPGVCVMSESDSDYLLLVQDGSQRTDPEPQLIAGAIAAFYQNNLHRKTAGKRMWNSQIISGIIMFGTVPTFYRIPVTADLVHAVQTGRHPVETTRVQRCVPPVPNQDAYIREGLIPLVNRYIVMQCYEAFKTLIFPQES